MFYSLVQAPCGTVASRRMEHLASQLELEKLYINKQSSKNNSLMADVRSLLRNERNARRISHRHAKYTEAGKLYCVVCRLELKSESLWNDHLRSKDHSILLKRNGNDAGSPASSPEPESAQTKNSDEEEAKSATPTEREPPAKQTKKRKASDDDDEEEQVEISRKRSKNASLPGFLPQGFFDDATKADADGTPSSNSNGQEFRLPSRPATPLKAPDAVSEAAKLPTVDEDEWAAFEADIAAAEVAAETTDDAVISAAPMTTEEVAAKSREEEMSARKEKAEADLEGDKEDAVRKLEDEFEQMNELEERVRRLKEKREALRVKEPVTEEGGKPEASNSTPEEEEEDDDDDDGEEDDDWAGFRLRG
ncbi:hypothetical protein V498_04682 [Pseudogymnoascus sp. VKM F-4517 (FW-2822)]|nr:hypothetical protein V498_04682 [Pseudogymnoascus sp. VKM F-4517 (FW-2822)]